MSKKHPLSADEKNGIVLAVKSAFTQLRNLYAKVLPVFEEYGFRAPSAGVIARDLSEKIETSIVQHCQTFTKGDGPADLNRFGKPWEVKICKDSGMTINQSKVIAGKNYIVVNYRANSQVAKIWVLWNAKDAMFSPRKPNSNARSLNVAGATAAIELILETATSKPNRKKPQ